MSYQPLRITEERAHALLKQCKWLLIVCVVAFVLFCVLAYSNKMGTPTWIAFGVYWFTGVGYFIWLGRLAHGLRRSVIYYVGGTWLASSGIFLIAHIIAFSNINSAVKKAFNPVSQAVSAAT